jgi:mono/diheme cytochrome c family protein
MGPIRSAILLLSAAALVAVGPAAPLFSTETQPTRTQAGMRGIFLTLVTAYRYSIDPQAFEDPSNHTAVRDALRALSVNASELEGHGGGLNPSFGYLRRSLARDARDVIGRFDRGQYMGARFVLGEIVQNCVTCHTKLPAKKGFELGAEFTGQAEIHKLPPLERVNLEVAARQFAVALDTYEKLFADPKTTLETLDLVNAFAGYLRVCIGALNDATRPLRIFEAYSQRSDISPAERELVTGWVAALENTDLEKSARNELPTAQRLVEEAEAGRKHAEDRSGLVNYVVATSLLHRFVETDPKNANDLSEAYYLMGVAEDRITRSYWISETDFLMEQAIRANPKSTVAKKAYAFLREHSITAHQESSAREVPPELRANLEELRKLIEE